jgi:dihydrofolate reductase
MIYGMLTSLDGYIDGLEGGPQLPMFGEALHRYFNGTMEETAVAVYGRTMYEIMRVWQTLDEDPNLNPWEVDFAVAWRKVPKAVVSTTLKEVGPNARLVSSNVEAELRKLKAGTDGLVDVSGSVLAAAAGRMGLIDEYRMFVRPIVLGGGKPFFRPDLPLDLKLIGAEDLPEGTLPSATRLLSRRGRGSPARR